MEIVKDYWALTKPRVIELLLVATIPVMLLADRGNIHLSLILHTFFAGWFGAACANSLNMIIDADIDKKMQRTKNRPIAAGRVSKLQGLFFSLGLGTVSLIWFIVKVNVLSAFLVLFTILFYVVIYTIILKRNTQQNIIWGGIAGCMPALVGWSAVRNSLGWPAVILFLVIFFWTPPHTWSLAIKYKDDYQNAEVPMLPVVESNYRVTRQIRIFTIATVICSILLIPFSGWLYMIVSLGSGVWFVWLSDNLVKESKKNLERASMRFFLKSNIYLAILFTAIAVDSILALPLIIN